MPTTMKRFQLLLILALAATTTFISCKKDSSNPVTPGGDSGKDFMPLAVGNWWEYNEWTLDSMGMKEAGSVVQTKDSVIATVTAGGRTAFLLAHIQSDTLTSTDTMAFDANGDLLAYADTGNTGHQVWMSAYHLSNTDPSKRYPTYMSFAMDSAGTVMVIDTMIEKYVGSESVTVPAGTFTARRYAMTQSMSFSMTGATFSSAGSTDMYFVAHKGRVKNQSMTTTTFSFPGMPETVSTSGTLQELTGYHIQ
jgi:hypothetical protein